MIGCSRFIVILFYYDGLEESITLNINGLSAGVKSVIYYVDQLNGQCQFSVSDHCFILKIIV